MHRCYLLGSLATTVTRAAAEDSNSARGFANVTCCGRCCCCCFGDNSLTFGQTSPKISATQISLPLRMCCSVRRECSLAASLSRHLSHLARARARHSFIPPVYDSRPRAKRERSAIKASDKNTSPIHGRAAATPGDARFPAQNTASVAVAVVANRKNGDRSGGVL